jgi:5-methylcytosine-specific restriction endonuclease McrA
MRDRVFERDDFRCEYCGVEFPAEALSVDHVQPRVRGGDRSGGNLVTACGGCNTRKGHRRLAEFLADERPPRRTSSAWRRGTYARHLRAVAEELARRGAGARARRRRARDAGGPIAARGRPNGRGCGPRRRR